VWQRHTVRTSGMDGAGAIISLSARSDSSGASADSFLAFLEANLGAGAGAATVGAGAAAVEVPTVVEGVAVTTGKVGRLGRIPAKPLAPLVGRKLGRRAAWMAEARGDRADCALGSTEVMGLKAALAAFAADDRAPVRGA
jgi:hypothetical protein